MDAKSRRNAIVLNTLEQLESRRLLSSAEATGVLRTIEGMTFEQEGTLNGSPGFGTIPPSPQVAAGPEHLVSITNSAIEFHTKTGTRTFQQNLFGFFQNQAFTEMFDAHVMYDPNADRFVVVAVDWTDTTFSVFGNTSRLFFAVSDDADPNGNWTYSELNSRLQIAGQPHWADGLGAAIGNGALFLTANMHRFGALPTYGGSRVWIIDYQQLLAGTLSFTVHDPFTASGLTANERGFMPTNIRSPIGNNVGTYLLNSNGYTDGLVNDRFAMVTVANPLTTPTFTNQFVSMGGDVDNQLLPLPGAPQQGSSVTLLPNDRRFQTAGTWINGTLYAANTVLPPGGADSGQNTARWYQVNVNGTGAATLAASGNVGAENIGAATHTFYPSIAADGDGNWGMTFSASGGAIFPSAAFTTGIGASVQPAAIYAAGESFYVRTYRTPSSLSSNNRWGDWTGIAHDPADGTFWAFNLYAGTQGSEFQGELGRWRTRMANFAATDAPPRMGKPDLIAASDSGVAPADNITNDNTPTFRGWTLPGATVTLFADAAQIGQTIAAADGTWAITSTVLLDGVRAITSVANNGSGTSPTSPPLNVTIDTAAPLLNMAVFNFETGHSLDFTFSEHVASSVAPEDFVVTNITVSQTIPAGAQAVGFNPAGTVVTLAFPGLPGIPPGILADGNHTAAITASAVTDRAGNPVAAPPFGFFVLAGDANRDRIIDIGDFSILATRFNLPGTFSQGDFNYDGITDIGDFAILGSKFNWTLPAPSDLPRATTSTPRHLARSFSNGSGAPSRMHLLPVNSLRELFE